jgi:paraquat-inducible protein A
MSAAATHILACEICGQAHQMPPLPAGRVAICVRCGSRIAEHSRGTLHITAALALAALILYVPANLFPILQMDLYGAHSQNTIWDGCQRLWQTHDQFVAIIVFLASIVIPLLKLAALSYLVISTKLYSSHGRRVRTWIYRIIEVIGRWSMLDVFVLAILVSLVKLQRLATIIPGRGAAAFACVVILTTLASQCFDPQMIWMDGGVNGENQS